MLKEVAEEEVDDEEDEVETAAKQGIRRLKINLPAFHCDATARTQLGGKLEPAKFPFHANWLRARSALLACTI